MEIKFNEEALVSMNKEELTEVLAKANFSAKTLQGFIDNLRERIFNMTVSEAVAKFPKAKEAVKVKVEYEKTHGWVRQAEKKNYTEVGYFVRFGHYPTMSNWDRDRVYLVLHQVKKDGTEGARFTSIPVEKVTSIEPCE